MAGAPSLATVLPTFLEFARGAVIVAHNAAFDVGFLNANLLRLDYPTLPAPAVCTAKLARRLVWPEVPNVRLRTLAGYFRTRVQPTHRALQDAEATGEVLQGLLDVGQHLGIHTLGELYHACSARGRPNFAKISLAERLPRAPGVYVFRDRNEQILYVGKAKDLRARVKSYFYGDERKKVQDLVASVARIDTITTHGELEALVLESRLIARHLPRFNAHGKRWRRYVFLKLDPKEAWPRWKVARSADPADGAIYLGPFGSSSRATLAKEALEEAFPIRRCTHRWAAEPGSRRARSPTWAGVSRLATARAHGANRVRGPMAMRAWPDGEGLLEHFLRQGRAARGLRTDGDRSPVAGSAAGATFHRGRASFGSSSRNT